MKLFWSFICLIIFQVNLAQQKWFSKFGWWGVDIGNDVVETLDGHFLVTGYTSSFSNGNSDVLISKVHKNGWEMWTKHYGGINNDIGKALVSTADSGFVIAGYTNSFGNGGYDGLLIKINKLGDTIWTRTFGGVDWDFFNAVQQTSDKGFVMGGYSYSNSNGAKDVWIVKTDSTGNLQWEKRWGGFLDDEIVSVEILHDNRIACFGTTYSFSDNKGNYFIYKTNINGDSLFFKDFGYSNLEDIGYDFFERPIDSAFVICGSSQSPFNTDTMYYHQMVVDSVGNVMADKKESQGQLKNQIAYTNAYLNGYKHYSIYDLWGQGQGKHEPGIYVFTNQWFLDGGTYGSSENDYLLSCRRTSDKGLVAVGYTTGFNAKQEDVFIVKLDSTLDNANNVVSVDIKEKKMSLNIYPNIASDYIYIDLNKMANSISVMVFDMQGRKLKEWKIASTSEQLDISELEEGIYLIYVRVNNNVFTGKFIKKSLF
ncbi:MAG: hypothetical protein KatS3mg027_0078 [Bacteroidia bacterium]|nr:MAG: hypothetical protein KatS3mg027_0078 [Bacteroidia bacterium]